MDTKEKYFYFMDCVYGVGPKLVQQLMDTFEDPREAYLASENSLAQILGAEKAKNWMALKQSFDLDKEYAKLKEQGIDFYSLWAEGYPEKLREIPDPPLALYVKGDLPTDKRRSVAVVGARRCSAYGREIAREIGIALGLADIQVISGMALGIDGIAQQGALSAGGNTYGVLGCGVDICYPERHRELYERMQERGGVLSSYKPGTVPKPEYFPPRNRIISGLSDVVIVVEAGEKSGTLITVDMALEQGRDIFCVPGRVTDRLSGGCNRLIEQGAHVVLSVDTLVEKLTQICNFPAEHAEVKKGTIDKIDKSMTNREKEVFELLDIHPVSGEQIFMQLSAQSLYNWTFREVSQTMWELILKGLAESVSGGFYIKKSSY